MLNPSKKEEEKDLLSKKRFQVSEEIWARSSVGDRETVVFGDGDVEVPVLIWVDKSEEKNTDLGSMTETRTPGPVATPGPSQHRRC